MAQKNKVDVYDIVTEHIIAEMEKGIIPWQQPWCGGSDEAISYTSRKPYSLLNQMLLGKPGEYLTYKQAVALGGQVKKGAKGKMVVFYTMVNQKKVKEVDETTGEETGKVKTVITDYGYPVLRFYTVFHLDDIEGLESKIEKDTSNDHDPIEEAERVASEYVEREEDLTLIVKHSNRAYYSPKEDKVVVPELAQYKIKEEYYSTLYHELTHSTGISKRCNRKIDSVAAFGDMSYAKEELVAEIGSAMTLNRLGIDCEKAFKNSVGYLQGWLKALRDDKKMIVIAAGQAQKAVDYIFDKKPTQE